MKEIIAIPDIHGRTFWKIVENDKSDSTIVFLGDYLDPYPHEKITFEDALVNFEEIIDFAKDRKNVVLLVGNHDYHYYFRTGNLGWSRYNPKFASDAHTLFQDNKNLFTVAYQVENTLFTHAGVDSDWYKNCVENREGNVATQLNNLFQTNPELFKIVSRSRGGWYPFGSPIWSDYDDIYFSDLLQNGKIRQIFGHTMGSIMRNYKNMYCLDCQRVFRVTDQEVKEY